MEREQTTLPSQIHQVLIGEGASRGVVGAKYEQHAALLQRAYSPLGTHVPEQRERAPVCHVDDKHDIPEARQMRRMSAYLGIYDKML